LNEEKEEAGAEHHLLPKNAHARADPLRVLLWVMTVLVLTVPPALRSVSPKMAKKMIGAMMLLMPKKYCTLLVLARCMNRERGSVVILWYRVCIGREAEAESKAQSHTFLPW
jgi:hypothetical protein